MRVTCAWIVFGRDALLQIWVKVQIVGTLEVVGHTARRALVVGAAVDGMRVELIFAGRRVSVRTHEVLRRDGGCEQRSDRGQTEVRQRSLCV